MNSCRADVYRQYSVQTKMLVALSGNPRLFPELNVPRSTARYWIARKRSVLSKTRATVSHDEANLRLELDASQAEVRRLTTILKLVRSTAALAGHEISWKRFPRKEQKERFLAMIDTAQQCIPLDECLEAVGISLSRYKAWKRRAVQCRLNDRSSCPRTMPQQLTQDEIAEMARLYHDPDLSHLSLTSLALYAQRAGRLYCSAHTWSDYARKLGWHRTRVRIYPKRDREGVRAPSPNSIWHIDVTQIKLANGGKRYIQAVMDNYSRYVLAWRITDGMGGMETKKCIEDALREARRVHGLTRPNVYSDAGFENVNSKVNSLVRRGRIQQTLAQFDVSFSNSMIEALFSALKNRYLYHQALSSPPKLQQEVDFYFREHNTRIPQQVLGGATPIEIFQGRWTETEKQELAARSAAARHRRKVVNRAFTCSAPNKKPPCLFVSEEH